MGPRSISLKYAAGNDAVVVRLIMMMIKVDAEGFQILQFTRWE